MSFSLKSFILFSLITLSFFSTHTNGAFSEQSLATTTRMEKTTHLHFFFHDILDGPSPSAVRIISPQKGPSSFGTTFMTDDPLTEGPGPSSRLVGRAQGMYAIASQPQNDFGLLMVMNYAFTEGIYKGSTLSVVGRNAVFEDVREMAIVGGSGVFRFARGFALAKTVWFDPKSGNAVVEYNVSVSHF